MKHSCFSNAPGRRETQSGWIFYLLSFTVLFYGLEWFNGLLAIPLTEAKLNFLYYCINFVGAVWIFRNFLGDSLRAAVRRLFPTLWYAALGYLGMQALGNLLTYLLIFIAPDFSNLNDLSLTLMARSEPLLALALVLLVPVAEECFFRGLLFRNLCNRNPLVAYLISMAAFSAIHVVGFLGSLSPVHLLISFIQYLPAAYCLCWCYHQTGTIITPILMHTLVNAMGVYNTVR